MKRGSAIGNITGLDYCKVYYTYTCNMFYVRDTQRRDRWAGSGHHCSDSEAWSEDLESLQSQQTILNGWDTYAPTVGLPAEFSLLHGHYRKQSEQNYTVKTMSMRNRVTL